MNGHSDSAIGHVDRHFSICITGSVYPDDLPPEWPADNLAVNTDHGPKSKIQPDFRRRAMKFLRLMFLPLLFAGSLLSQTATLTGVVKDSTGAVMARTEITATQTERNLTFRTVS